MTTWARLRPLPALHRLFLGTVLVLCGVTSSGQTLGEITGRVTDESGAVLPGARVTVTNEGTNATRAMTANPEGLYRFPFLQPGRYRVEAELAGFQKLVRSGIELQVQQVARVDFKLRLGGVTEAVEIVAGTPLLTTENASLGTVIENKRITELPLNGRNFLQLVALTPNVSFDFASAGHAQNRQGGDRARQNISVAGQRSEFNNFTLDGIENTDVNFNTYIALPSVDALEEFKVVSGVFPAEYGREPSQVSISTRGGTNAFHGALFEYLRDDSLDARSYAFTSVVPPKEPFSRHNYGYTVSGPILKNRLFFMSNWEGLRDRRTVTRVATVPTEAMRAGDFSGIKQTICDPLTRVRQPNGTITAQPFPGNVIPPSRIHPKAVSLLEFYPAPNVPGAGTASNYQGLENQSTDRDSFLQRIDFVESSTSNWFARVSWGKELSQTPGTFPDQGTKLDVSYQQAVLSNTRTFGNSVVNELRLGYNHFKNENLNHNAYGRDVITEIGGFPGLATPVPEIYGIPLFDITGFTGFGETDNAPFINDNHILQVIDNLSFVKGRHSFRVGFEIRRDMFDQKGNQFPRGNFVFQGQTTQNPSSPSGTGNSFADFLLGMQRRTEASLALAAANFRTTYQAYYIDDTWRITPKLTLQLGLRYENAPPFLDELYNIVNADLPPNMTDPAHIDPSDHPVLVRAGSGDFYEGVPLPFNPAIQLARDGRMGDRLVKTDNNDFAPRVGVTYSPTDRWTLRAGFGRFYAQDTGNPRFDMARNIAGRRRDEANNDFPDLSFDQPFRVGAVPTINSPFVLANLYDRKTPYNYAFLFSVQRQLAQNTALEVAYAGNLGRGLERLRPLNDPLPGPGSVATRRPYPELGTIQIVDTAVDSSYNGLSLRLSQNFSRGLTYLLSYTWSRAIDNGSAIREHGGDSIFPQNPYDLGAERGLSNFHVAHRLVGSVLWELPVGRGKRLGLDGVANAILGGWQVGSIFTWQTGTPYTIAYGVDVANIGEGTQRPDLAPGADPNLSGGERTPQRWFNTAAFTAPAPYTFGDVGRNTMIGPGRFLWDFSLIKNTPVWKGHSLQFRLEAFNFTNHPNFGFPTAVVTNASFGRITTTTTRMRELQFGIRYQF